MPIKNLQYSHSIESVNTIGLKSWKKFGADYELEENEDKSKARELLKAFVHDSLNNQPQEQEPEYKSVVPSIQEEEKPTLSEEQQIIEGINSVQELKWLKLWDIKANHSDLTQLAYIQKKKQLLLTSTIQ